MVYYLLSMELVLKNLIFSVDRDIQSVYAYLRLLGVSVTKTGLATLLREHPDTGTLLSVSDVLTGLGVENVVAKVSEEQLGQLETPFIARMKSGEGLALAVVKRLDDDALVYLSPSTGSTVGKQRWVSTSKQAFSEEFGGIVLIGEAGPGAGQEDYVSARAAENKKLNGTIAALAVLPMLTILAVATAFTQQGWGGAVSGLYTLLSFSGTAVAALLLWYEVDRHNPLLRKVCSGGRKVNCDAILDSSASNIFGVSWSLIGFSYFMGSLLMLLAVGITDPVLFSLLSLLSLLAVGYVAFSLYYQWRIAGQWCKLCLAIQGILLAQAGLVLAYGQFFTGTPIDVSVPAVLTLLICFAVPFLTGLLIVPAFKKGKEGENHRRELARIKHNPQIFEALLKKQKAITSPAEGLGITLGNPEARHRIIKVCNPYCGPCAKAHPAIEEILNHNPDVQVQIIFTASDDERDFGALPVRHLLAVAEKGDGMLLKKALNDWYLATNKDYGMFAAKYPMNGELATQGEKLTAMRRWCERTAVQFTPTFFVNGYQLADMYSVEDLKYILQT